jgi:cell division protein FtsB
MEARLEDARMLNKRLAREVNLLQNDPEYLGMFARDRVNPGYMKEGETIFRFAPRSQR